MSRSREGVFRSQWESLTPLEPSYILAKSLSEYEYQMLMRVAQGTLATADPIDRIGIKQRLDELRFYWNDLKERPTV